jgi:hypothetical protein
VALGLVQRPRLLAGSSTRKPDRFDPLRLNFLSGSGGEEDFRELASQALMSLVRSEFASPPGLMKSYGIAGEQRTVESAAKSPKKCVKTHGIQLNMGQK